MISPRDLRVGNFVHCTYPDEKWAELHTICRYDPHKFAVTENPGGYYLHVSSIDLEPIPLTSEILENCGFKNYRYWWNISSQNTFALEEWNDDGLGVYLCVGGLKTGQYIKYLHKLQNLFYSLTGEELKIKIP